MDEHALWDEVQRRYDRAGRTFRCRIERRPPEPGAVP